LILIHLSDTHSAYDNYPGVLNLVENVVQENDGTPVFILFNGNLFGRYNVLTARSEGEIDWAFLQALRNHAPVIFNIGPWDLDFVELREFYRRAESYGITVISNLLINWRDRRIHAVAPALTVRSADGQRFNVAGVASAIPTTYLRDVREDLLLRIPRDWMDEGYINFAIFGRWTVVLSQAQVFRDRPMLDVIPEGALVIGSGQPFSFRKRRDGTVYLQTGVRAERVSVTRVSFNGDQTEMEFETHVVSESTPANQELRALIEQVREAHLKAEDTAIVGQVEQNYSTTEAARWAVEALREATDADVVMLDRNFFRAGLKSGPVMNYEFDQFLPFDSDAVTATVDGATLAEMLGRANQEPTTPLTEMRNNFVYATEIEPQEDETYTVVTAERVAQNARTLLGTEEITFEALPVERSIKSMLAAALDAE
jgi:2',3'-cyclic-nucleotide 2'-phosphodiesterase (5'-nucleotidase family)